MISKTYKLNNFLTLKLEDKKTNIYVDEKLFMHCKYLLLNLTKEDFQDYDEIKNMDDAIKIYSRKNERDKTILDPETEFMGHCSNLQAWVEYYYDLDILASNLAFPLLKELVKAGDRKATITLKEEVLKRVNSKNRNTIIFMASEGYLDSFTYEELQTLFDEIDEEYQEVLHIINKMMNEKRILEKLIKRQKQNTNKKGVLNEQ